jgi:hypothetical protein
MFFSMVSIYSFPSRASRTIDLCNEGQCLNGFGPGFPGPDLLVGVGVSQTATAVASLPSTAASPETGVQSAVKT